MDLPTFKLIKYPLTLYHEKFMTYLLCSVHYLTHFGQFLLIWLLTRSLIPDFQHSLDKDFFHAIHRSHPVIQVIALFSRGEGEGVSMLVPSTVVPALAPPVLPIPNISHQPDLHQATHFTKLSALMFRSLFSPACFHLKNKPKCKPFS